MKDLQIALYTERLEKLTNKKVKLVEFQTTSVPSLDFNVPYNKKKGYHLIDNEDFQLRYDIVGDGLQLMWIHNKTNKIKGRDIFGQLIKFAQSIGMTNIYAWWCSGTIDKMPATGYITGMRWGFIPVDGINFVNKVLKTNYKNFEEAYADPNFLENWKQKGKDFTGEFDLSPNSLSMKIFNTRK